MKRDKNLTKLIFATSSGRSSSEDLKFGRWTTVFSCPFSKFFFNRIVVLIKVNRLRYVSSSGDKYSWNCVGRRKVFFLEIMFFLFNILKKIYDVQKFDATPTFPMWSKADSDQFNRKPSRWSKFFHRFGDRRRSQIGHIYIYMGKNDELVGWTQTIMAYALTSVM